MKQQKQLSVLVIAQYYPPDMGGGATRAYNAVKGMILNGAKVTVIAAFPHYPHGNIPKQYRWKPLKIEWQEGVKIIRTFVPPLPSKGLAYRLVLFLSFAVSSLFALPALGKIDVVWAANPNIISFYPAQIYAWIKRVPVALNVDDLWPEDMYSFNLLKPNNPLAKVAETLARIAYNKAKTITPISPYYKLVICGRYRIEPSKVKTVRAGVDTSKFKPCPPRQHGGKFTVLYSGAFSVAYDFEQVLQAAMLLQDKNVEFVLQGGGEVAPLVKKRVKELGLTNVKVVDKILPRERVAKLLCQADALLLPLKDFGRPYLGISSKLYEYQAAGKPILCAARGAPALHVLETHSGLVSRPGDFDALAKNVLELARNPQLTEKLRDSGRRYIEKELKTENIGREMLKALTAERHYARGNGGALARASNTTSKEGRYTIHNCSMKVNVK
jgi:glycosyltransferase involved in cell wall biosynthesis